MYARIFESLEQRILGRARDENIVWCDASLSRIHTLAPHDTACSSLEVTFRVDNNGGLPTKLSEKERLHQYITLNV
jgi:hypothetical protein